MIWQTGACRRALLLSSKHRILDDFGLQIIKYFVFQKSDGTHRFSPYWLFTSIPTSSLWYIIFESTTISRMTISSSHWQRATLIYHNIKNKITTLMWFTFPVTIPKFLPISMLRQIGQTSAAVIFSRTWCLDSPPKKYSLNHLSKDNWKILVVMYRDIFMYVYFFRILLMTFKNC